MNRVKKLLFVPFLWLLIFAAGDLAAKPKSSKQVVPTQQGRKVIKPASNKSVGKLPPKHSTVNVKGANFYVSNGRYYRKSGVSFSLVLPPIGLRVSTLPPARKPFRYNNVIYYCDAGAVYKEVSSGEYEVVEPTVGMVVPELPEVNVSQVSIDGSIFYEYDKLLYKPIVTTTGIQYEVVGNLN